MVERDKNMISYCITVYKEIYELKTLLQLLKQVKQSGDEIVVIQTYRHEYEKTAIEFLDIQKICKEYSDTYDTFHFQNNFADMKNHMSNQANVNNKYIINFDADETMPYDMLVMLRNFLEQCDIDVLYLPRVNIVDNITDEDIRKWSWTVNQYGWINWPDYQSRIYKNNKTIRWSGAVHEQLTGYNTRSLIEADGSVYIYHRKNIDKQRKQNDFYNSI